MTFVRYGVPVAFLIAGVAMYFTGEPAGIHGLLMAIGAALSVIFINILFRFGAQGDLEREREAEAREYFARHGRWPDDPAPDPARREG